MQQKCWAKIWLKKKKKRRSNAWNVRTDPNIVNILGRSFYVLGLASVTFWVSYNFLSYKIFFYHIWVFVVFSEIVSNWALTSHSVLFLKWQIFSIKTSMHWWCPFLCISRDDLTELLRDFLNTPVRAACSLTQGFLTKFEFFPLLNSDIQICVVLK